MKNSLLIFSLIFLFAACQSKKSLTLNNSTISVSDTIINYDINDLSTEGGEATARYLNGKIDSAFVIIFGESGQSKITYKYHSDGTISGFQKDITYATDSLDNPNQEKTNTSKDYKFNLTKEGGLLTNIADKDFINYYPDIVKQLPIVIKVK